MAIAIALAGNPAAAAGRYVDDLRLGIVGAGKLGTALARAAVEAGYDVAISGSGPPEDIALTVDVLAPGARAVSTGEVVRHADVIVLAVPTHRFRELPRDLFDGKILVDAMNYWEPVDGTDDELNATADGTSTIVQQRFAGARVVKSLNQLGYHELDDNRKPPAARDRIAIGAAGDDRLAVRLVMRLLDRLGFDPVDAGPLENGLTLEPDGSPYAVTYSAAELSDLIAAREARDGPGISTGATDRPNRDSGHVTSPASKEQVMATIHINLTTTSTPEQFVAGLTDFGPGRSELFGNSADEYLEVHDRGPAHADVTEGSGGVWERLHYDWSDPNRVVMRTTDSNVWGGASGHTYTFTRQPDGTTALDAVVVREGKNLKGRALALVLGTVGKRVLAKALGKTVKAIEARNDGAGASELHPASAAGAV